MDWVTLVGVSNTSNCSPKYAVFYFFHYIFFACFIQFLFHIRFLTWQTLIQPEQSIFSECFMWNKDLCLKMWGRRFGILDCKVISMSLDYVFNFFWCVGDTTVTKDKKKENGKPGIYWDFLEILFVNGFSPVTEWFEAAKNI